MCLCDIIVHGNWCVNHVYTMLSEDFLSRLASIDYNICPPVSKIDGCGLIAPMRCTQLRRATLGTTVAILTPPRPTSNGFGSLSFQRRLEPSFGLFSLPTNDVRYRHYLATWAACHDCSHPQEDTLHCLRDCSHAREIWTHLGFLAQQ